MTQLSEVFAKVAKDPGFIKKINELGSDVRYRDQAAYKAYIEQETKRLELLAKEFDIQAK